MTAADVIDLGLRALIAIGKLVAAGASHSEVVKHIEALGAKASVIRDDVDRAARGTARTDPVTLPSTVSPFIAPDRDPK